MSRWELSLWPSGISKSISGRLNKALGILMSSITGLLLIVVGIGMVLFARPKREKSNWVSRFAFLTEIYVVAATSFVVLGVCVVFLK